VAVYDRKASAVCWLCIRILTVLCATLKELVWDAIVFCLEGRRREARELATDAYVFVELEMLLAVELIVVVVFWISLTESWVWFAVV
jgi:hypothetical protein